MIWLAVWLGVGACACGSGKGEPPAASGSLLFDPRPGESPEVFLATEIEVLRSQSLRDRIREDVHVDLAADAVVAERRPGALVLQIGVRDSDSQRAALACNALIRAYIDRRMEQAIVPIASEEQALDAEREKHPDDPKLVARIQELEMQRVTRHNDVRVLDACRAPAHR